MNLHLRLLYLFIGILLVSACKEQTKPITIQQTETTKGNYIVPIFFPEDTIPTGVDIPARGKVIHPDSVAQPKSARIKGQPKVIPFKSNVRIAGKPKVYKIPRKLTIFTPGKNGVSLPNITQTYGEMLPFKEPKPIPALPPKTKENATFDIRHLGVKEGLTSLFTTTPTLIDRRGNLWFSHTIMGVSKYDGRHFKHFSHEQGIIGNTGGMVEDRYGNIWLGSDNGLTCFSPGSNQQEGTFTHFTTSEGLIHDRVRSLWEDHKGNIWISGRGLNRFTLDSHGLGGIFTYFTTQEGLTRNGTWEMLQDQNDGYWFGTGFGGANRYLATNDSIGYFVLYGIPEGMSSSIIF